MKHIIVAAAATLSVGVEAHQIRRDLIYPLSTPSQVS
jgi:hypothetical protein